MRSLLAAVPAARAVRQRLCWGSVAVGVAEAWGPTAQTEPHVLQVLLVVREVTARMAESAVRVAEAAHSLGLVVTVAMAVRPARRATVAQVVRAISQSILGPVATAVMVVTPGLRVLVEQVDQASLQAVQALPVLL